MAKRSFQTKLKRVNTRLEKIKLALRISESRRLEMQKRLDYLEIKLPAVRNAWEIDIAKWKEAQKALDKICIRSGELMPEPRKKKSAKVK